MKQNILRTPSLWPAYTANRHRLETMTWGIQNLIHELEALGNQAVMAADLVERLTTLVNNAESAQSPHQPNGRPQVPQDWITCSPAWVMRAVPVRCDQAPRLEGDGDLGHLHPDPSHFTAHNARRAQNGCWVPYEGYELTEHQMNENTEIVEWVGHIGGRRPIQDTPQA